MADYIQTGAKKKSARPVEETTMSDKQIRKAQEFASVGHWDKILAIVEEDPELAFAQDERGDTLLMILFALSRLRVGY